MIASEMTILCPMCGVSFNPEANPGCPSCPLQKGCLMACCPECGYQSVVAERSAAARFTSRMIDFVQKFRDQRNPDRMRRSAR